MATFLSISATILPWPGPGATIGPMTPTSALFVRIRNAEGQYLGGDPRAMSFFDDIRKAIIFDCRRDHVEQQLENLLVAQGLALEAVPVDPGEIYETCDRCGRLVLAFRVFFDGSQYLCAGCRRAGQDG